MINCRVHTKLLALPMLALSLLAPNFARGATIWNATTDFSSTNNPNGQWAYGFEATLGGAFSPLTFSDAFDGLNAWATDANYPGGDAAPFIAHNPTASTITFSTFSVPSSELQLHPGPLGQYAVVRWTSPFATATSVTVNGHFSSQDNHVTPTPSGTTTDAHILRDGVSILDTNINGIRVITPFSLTVSVGAGDTLDFAVGFGSNLDYTFDSTGLVAQITPAPEPGAVILMISGLGLGIITRRMMT